MTKDQLYTPISILKSDFNITHHNPLIFIGSCFAENIGAKLKDNKFDILVNPNGIIYNPISVVNSIKRIVNNTFHAEKDLTYFNDRWISFNHHGNFSSDDKISCLENINTALQNAHQQFKKCKTLFITFGSAWVYEYPTVGIVANCHKIPNKIFNKRLLSVKEILTAFEEIKTDLKGIDIVFTVSPVRHVKDGLHENNLSKATLLLAINNLVEQNENYSYFPAYELIIDELRDYRFYKEDLVHPTELAVNFVWEKFCEHYFDEHTQNLNTAIQKVKAAVTHRSFNFESEAHQQFISTQIKLMDELTNKHPFLNFEEEKRQIYNDVR